MDKMKVEIWSDIMCPFCYIGKRKFEQALQKFDGSEDVSIEWHSFQLDPTMQSVPGKDVYSYLAERKGQSLDWSKQMHKQVADTAAAVGLTYNFDKAVIANSFDAHRLIQFAKTKGKGDEAEEKLFSAYFTEGKDMSNHAVLTALGEEIGLSSTDVGQLLNDDGYSEEVNADIEEAQQLGVTGVPFFVFDRKYAVAGAQAPEVFLQVLEKSFGEWRKASSVLQFQTAAGDVCEPGGDCI